MKRWSGGTAAAECAAPQTWTSPAPPCKSDAEKERGKRHKEMENEGRQHAMQNKRNQPGHALERCAEGLQVLGGRVRAKITQVIRHPPLGLDSIHPHAENLARATMDSQPAVDLRGSIRRQQHRHCLDTAGIHSVWYWTYWAHSSSSGRRRWSSSSVSPWTTCRSKSARVRGVSTSQHPVIFSHQTCQFRVSRKEQRFLSCSRWWNNPTSLSKESQRTIQLRRTQTRTNDQIC